MTEVHLAKEEFARLINAAPDEIAVFSSVSEATSAVASALDFTGGCYFVFKRATAGLAFGTPMTGPKPYEFEVLANLNIHF